ncbi:MAG: efflux RND transporter periplasmic adaptor subunit [Desulforhopalus sp.]
MQLNESINWTVLLTAMVAVFSLVSCERQPEDTTKHPIPEVSTVEVQPEKIMLTTELPGRTSAFRVAEIRPQISGLIQKRLFTEGSVVKAGQILYQIDSAPFQATLDTSIAALERAQASLSAVKSRAGRYKKLRLDKAVSQQDFDDAAADLAQIEADIRYYKGTVETARINLKYTKVIAPISGRIGKSNVTDGAIVTAYQPVALATIQQLDTIYIDMIQSTIDLLHLKSRLQKGLLNQQGENQNKVRLILEDGTLYTQEGILQFSDITVDPTTGSVTLRALFPNPEGVILPGMFVQALIKEGINEQAILIPQQGVSRDPKGKPYALVVDAESKADFRPLTLDRAIGDRWLIETGLTPGDQLIVDGLLMLRPGTVVKAAPFEKTKAEQNPMTSLNAASPKNSKEGV